MEEPKSAFDLYCEELDAFAKRAFEEHGFSTLLVTYQHDPFDGKMGTDVTRVGFRGGRMFALGAANYALSYVLDGESEDGNDEE